MSENAISQAVGQAVSQSEVTVWAELGRARLPLCQLLAMKPGSVVQLDHAEGTPLDLYVNGKRFATGRLEVICGEWAVRIERLIPSSPRGG